MWHPCVRHVISLYVCLSRVARGMFFCVEVVKIAFCVAAIGLVVAAAYGTASFILTSYVFNADSGQYTDTLVTLEDELKITIRPTVS